MFNLVQNDYLRKGRCKYEDENGNSAMFFKKDWGFSAKLRFSNSDFKTDPVEVRLPLKEGEGGFNLHLEFPGGHTVEEVKGATDGFTLLIQRWIKMEEAIKWQDASPAVVRAACESNSGNSCTEISDEDVAVWKFGLLDEFEELKPLTNAVFTK